MKHARTFLSPAKYIVAVHYDGRNRDSVEDFIHSLGITVIPGRPHEPIVAQVLGGHVMVDLGEWAVWDKPNLIALGGKEFSSQYSCDQAGEPSDPREPKENEDA